MIEAMKVVTRRITKVIWREIMKVIWRMMFPSQLSFHPRCFDNWDVSDYM